MKKHYEPEFKDLHPQVRHTAQWIFEQESRLHPEKDRAALIRESIFASKKHCEKKFGIVKGERVSQETQPPWD